MAKTYQPPFAQTPLNAVLAVAAANTSRDGSGTINTLLTAGSEGAYIDRIVCYNSQASVAASSAMVVVVWISIDGGTTWFKRQEAEVAAKTATNSAVTASQTINFTNGWKIPASAVVGITQTVYAGAQDRMTYVAEYGSY